MPSGFPTLSHPIDCTKPFICDHFTTSPEEYSYSNPRSSSTTSAFIPSFCFSKLCKHNDDHVLAQFQEGRVAIESWHRMGKEARRIFDDKRVADLNLLEGGHKQVRMGDTNGQGEEFEHGVSDDVTGVDDPPWQIKHRRHTIFHCQAVQPLEGESLDKKLYAVAKFTPFFNKLREEYTEIEAASTIIRNTNECSEDADFDWTGYAHFMLAVRDLEDGFDGFVYETDHEQGAVTDRSADEDEAGWECWAAWVRRHAAILRGRLEILQWKRK